MADGRGYRHLCEVASGGMGRVYVAVRRDDPSQTLWAVKRLHPHLRSDPRARASFAREERVAGDIDAPHVLRIRDAGEDQEGPFLAMEYIEGCSLAELYEAVRRSDEDFPLQICADIAQQLAAGLHAVHERRGGLLHGDVSPQNVLIDFSGRVVLADFGVARSLSPGARGSGAQPPQPLAGKVGYMAPERLRREPPDRRSDLFALGVVLWELVAGRRLYHGGGDEVARRITSEPPPDLDDDREDAPPTLVQLLFELLAKDPDARPPNAEAARARLQRILEELRACEGRVHLGDYALSFFEQRRRHRREAIAAALERSAALDLAAPVMGEPAIVPRRRRWRVKGAAIEATLGYLRARYGDAGLSEVLARCPPGVREALEGAVLVSAWYDGEVMVALTRAAQARFGEDEDGQLAVRIGAASADFAFGDGGPYEVFRQHGLRLGVGSFLESSAEIYRLYYDVGRWSVEEVTDTAAVMRVHDGVVFPASIVDRVRGYLRRGLELLGCHDVRVAHLTDGQDLLFTARWRRAPVSWPP